MVKKFLFDTWYGALVALASVSAVLLGAIVADGYLGVRGNIAWNVLSVSLFLAWIAACNNFISHIANIVPIIYHSCNSTLVTLK